MVDKPDNKSNKKVFDVAKPGKTAAEASGRPVIVGHKNMLKGDPMVTKRGISASDLMARDSDDLPSGSPAKEATEDSEKPTKAPSLANYW